MMNTSTTIAAPATPLPLLEQLESARAKLADATAQLTACAQQIGAAGGLPTAAFISLPRHLRGVAATEGYVKNLCEMVRAKSTAPATK